MLRHDLRRAFRVVVLETVADTLRHDLTDRRVAGGPLLGDRPYNDIPVGNHADKAVVLADGQRAKIIGPHTPRRIANGHVRIGDAHRWRHDFIDLHDWSPEPDLMMPQTNAWSFEFVSCRSANPDRCRLPNGCRLGKEPGVNLADQVVRPGTVRHANGRLISFRAAAISW